jgi:radical SAM-linked protein
MGKYISHLDLLRTFTRAIHRADLPVRYSQGFNPHQLITFSLPLALGTTSETEFVDIDFEDGTDFKTVIEKLNKNLPPDIKILEASVPQIKAKEIVSAEYIFDVMLDEDVCADSIVAFFEQSEIPAIKKTKRGEKEINLKEFIHSYEILGLTHQSLKLKLVLSAGGENNIKPGILADKLCGFLGKAKPENTEIHRTQIFYSDGKKIKNFC